MPDVATPERLAALADADVRALLEDQPDISTLVYREGECLVVEGETGRDVFMVLQGAVVVEQGEGSSRVVLALLEAEPHRPIILGEMAWFGELPRSATVRVSGATTVLRLEPRHLDRILQSHPGLTASICRQFTWRLKEANQALMSLQNRFRLDPRRHMAQDGEVLFRAGESAAELWQLMAGEVWIGDRAFTAETLPGGFLDLEPYLLGGVHRITATAKGMAFLAVIASDRREAVVRTFPEAVLRLVARRRG